MTIEGCSTKDRADVGRDRDEGHWTKFPGMCTDTFIKRAVISLCVTVSSFGIETGRIYHWTGL